MHARACVPDRAGAHCVEALALGFINCAARLHASPAEQRCAAYMFTNYRLHIIKYHKDFYYNNKFILLLYWYIISTHCLVNQRIKLKINSARVRIRVMANSVFFVFLTQRKIEQEMSGTI